MNSQPHSSKKTILVTGGAGFIGTHLCRSLISQGHDVRSLDLKDPKDPVPGVNYVLGDLRNPVALRKEMQGVSAVYHFGAIVNVNECQEKPHESYLTNLMGTVEVLEAVRAEILNQGAPVRMIFASSAAVYGRKGQEGIAIRESDVADEPLSFYAAQKLNSEHAIRMYFEHRGVPSVVFRFFNVFGVGQDPTSPYSGVITIFSRLAREGKNLVLNAGGYQTRDFISVHDIVSANVKALDLELAQCDGRAFNLGTGRTITVRELGEMIQRISKSTGAIETGPARQGDVPHSRADKTRASQILHWEPRVGLEEGLSELLSLR